METLTLIGTIVGAIFGSQVLVTVAQGWFRREKTDAESDAIRATQEQKFIELLTKRVDKLETDIELYRRENLELHKELSAVKTELRLFKETNGSK